MLSDRILLVLSSLELVKQDCIHLLSSITWTANQVLKSTITPFDLPSTKCQKLKKFIHLQTRILTIMTSAKNECSRRNPLNRVISRHLLKKIRLLWRRSRQCKRMDSKDGRLKVLICCQICINKTFKLCWKVRLLNKWFPTKSLNKTSLTSIDPVKI